MADLRPDEFAALEQQLRDALSARAATVTPSALDAGKAEALREALNDPSGAAAGSGAAGAPGAGGTVSTWADRKSVV